MYIYKVVAFSLHQFLPTFTVISFQIFDKDSVHITRTAVESKQEYKQNTWVLIVQFDIQVTVHRDKFL